MTNIEQCCLPRERIEHDVECECLTVFIIASQNNSTPRIVRYDNVKEDKLSIGLGHDWAKTLPWLLYFLGICRSPK